MTRQRIALVVTLIMSFGGCGAVSAPHANPSPAEAVIREARAEQNRAIEAGQFDEVARYWTDDITVRAGLGFPLAGSQAYRGAFSADSGVVYVRQTTSVQLSEDYPLAWEEGTWIGKSRLDGRVLISGRYAAQWIKIEGAWKIRSELFVALECEHMACGWPVYP